MDEGYGVGHLVGVGGGGAGLTALVVYIVNGLKKRADERETEERTESRVARERAETEWKAELKADVKETLHMVNQMQTLLAVQGQELASVKAQISAVDHRQSEQAKAHRTDREDHGRRIANLEAEMTGILRDSPPRKGPK